MTTEREDFISQYTPKDWMLIIAALMRKQGIESVEITLEELDAMANSKQIVGMAHLPGLLVLKFISAADAAKLRDLGAVVHGTIDPTKLN